jgi:hypothetical protein
MLDKFSRHIQNPHFQVLVTLAFLAYSELSNPCSKTRKLFVRSISVPETGRTCSYRFPDLNDDCSAQDNPRELKMPENKNSECAYIIF